MAADPSYRIYDECDSFFLWLLVIYLLKYELMTLKITLTTGDFLYSEKFQFLVRMKGLEPSRREAHAPKACVSTNSTTSA